MWPRRNLPTIVEAVSSGLLSRQWYRVSKHLHTVEIADMCVWMPKEKKPKSVRQKSVASHLCLSAT